MNVSHEIAEVLIVFGSLFLVGLLADLAGRHTPLPRVTLLLLAGFLIGPSGLDLLPQFTGDWFPVLTSIALAMIGFLLGHKLTLSTLRELGRSVLAMSLCEATLTALLVCSVLSLFGVPLEIAILLAGIAPATAPAATVDVVRELNAKGKFTDTLLGIVAIDDAWGLLIFSVLLALAQALTGLGGAGEVLASGAWEIGGALLLGTALGIPMAYVTGRVRPGEPTLPLLSGAEPATRRRVGMALLPQAGVAIGMALVASQHFPELEDTILPVVLGATVVFELIGPVITRRILIRMGEAQGQP